MPTSMHRRASRCNAERAEQGRAGAQGQASAAPPRTTLSWYVCNTGQQGKAVLSRVIRVLVGGNGVGHTEEQERGNGWGQAAGRRRAPPAGWCRSARWWRSARPSQISRVPAEPRCLLETPRPARWRVGGWVGGGPPGPERSRAELQAAGSQPQTCSAATATATAATHHKDAPAAGALLQHHAKRLGDLHCVAGAARWHTLLAVRLLPRRRRRCPRCRSFLLLHLRPRAPPRRRCADALLLMLVGQAGRPVRPLAANSAAN